MLVNLKEILKYAEDKKIAVGAFNTPDMTTLRAVLSAAEELNRPVVIMHAQIHEEAGVSRIDQIAPVMLMFARKAAVPVCVHLDHGTDLGYVRRALELGFNSVMFDGSELPAEENVLYTRSVVNEAAKYGASVEAEIGSMGPREGQTNVKASVYTDPDAAAEFADETGIDALACAFGTAHGFSRGAPKLDLERLCEIHSKLKVPIVMHGGSGLTEQDFRDVVTRGVRKVNYYTFMAKAGAEAINNKQYRQFHDVLRDAERATKEDVMRAIRVFSLSE
ncbi:MAG: class II fructose-bisphosphate aldolase [Clostridia bacterium]|nr:class II fructose-bisphosphate aldolase [Clostridia bacterium]